MVHLKKWKDVSLFDAVKLLDLNDGVVGHKIENAISMLPKCYLDAISTLSHCYLSAIYGLVATLHSGRYDFMTKAPCFSQGLACTFVAATYRIAFVAMRHCCKPPLFRSIELKSTN
jgi:hypothetical protein